MAITSLATAAGRHNPSKTEIADQHPNGCGMASRLSRDERRALLDRAVCETVAQLARMGLIEVRA